MSDSPEPSTADTLLALPSLLKHPVIDGDGRTPGKLADVLTRPRDNHYPRLTSLVISLACAGYSLPMNLAHATHPDAVPHPTATVD